MRRREWWIKVTYVPKTEGVLPSRCIFTFSFRVLDEIEGRSLPCRGITIPSPYASRTLPPLSDPALGEWLKAIMGKLDSLLHLFALDREGFSALPLQSINISGSGMSFVAPHPIPPGSRVEAQMVLTSGLMTPLYLVGEVVASEPQGNGYRIGMRFVNLDESIRNEIIRFVFIREREILRGKREM